MIIKELMVLSEALWESVRSDLDFFSSIQSFSRKLAEFDFSTLTKDDLPELKIYADKIEQFFRPYRPLPDVFYIPPRQTKNNDDTARRIFDLIHRLASLNETDLQIEVQSVKPKTHKKSKGEGLVFIGHGRSNLWARVKIYFEEELSIRTLSFESESRTSESIIPILEDFLNRASNAVLIMTAEDETSDGNARARQNVIHEAGLFQGRLGFENVIIIKQNGIEEFTNIAGLQYIAFDGNNIEQSFYELSRKMKKLGLLK